MNYIKITNFFVLLVSTNIYIVVANPIESSHVDEVSSTKRSIFREARQEDSGAGANTGTGTGTNAGTGNANGGAAGNNVGYLYSTYANVGQILNGVFEGDIAPILAGGAAFIPAGELRQGVSQLLTRQVAPQVQELIRNVGSSIQRQFNRTTPNPNLAFAQTNPNQNGQLPDTPTGPVQAENQGSRTAVINIPNPLEALQNTIQSNSQTGGSPFDSIRSRLQSLIPINIAFGGSNKSNTNNANSESSNVNTNTANSGGNTAYPSSNNQFKYDVPRSP